MSTARERFEAFDRANPHIYKEIVSRCYRLLRKNQARRFGLQVIIESIRYDHAIQTSGDLFKINHNYRSFYARKVLREHPDLEGKLMVRSSAADDNLTLDLQEVTR